MGKLTGEHCCVHGTVCAGNEAGGKRVTQLERVNCQQVGTVSRASRPEPEHAAQHLCQEQSQHPAMAPACATAVTPTQPLAPGISGICWDSRSQGSGGAGPCQGKAFVFSMGKGVCCRCSWCSWIGFVFQQPYAQTKASLQIYAQLILLCRWEFFSAQLCCFVLLKWPICVQWLGWLLFTLGIMLAALTLQVVARAGCVQCGSPANLMQQQFDPCPSPFSYCHALCSLSFDRLSKQNLYLILIASTINKETPNPWRD